MGIASDAVEAVVGEEAIGTEAHGFGECGLAAVSIGEPDIDVGESFSDAGDDGQFFAIEAVETENYRVVKEGSAAKMNHGFVRFIDFGA